MLTMIMLIGILQAREGVRAYNSTVTGSAVSGTACSMGALDSEVEDILVTGAGVEAYEEIERENMDES